MLRLDRQPAQVPRQWYFLQRYSPRRSGSSWSRINVERAETLMAAGRMRPSGLAAIEAAKGDGRWAAAYESQRTATVPPDLKAALARDERARACFESLGRTERYALILQLMKAQSTSSRTRRLKRIVTLLRAGKRCSEPAATSPATKPGTTPTPRRTES